MILLCCQLSSEQSQTEGIRVILHMCEEVPKRKRIPVPSTSQPHMNSGNGHRAV